MSNRQRGYFILWRGSTIGDVHRFNGFRDCRKNAATCSGGLGNFWGTMPREENWVGYDMPAHTGMHTTLKELNMRNKILAIAAIAAAISAPVAAQAQSDTVGIVRGGSVIINDDVGGIAPDQRPAFREYIVRERVPDYTIRDRVVVGGVLPETGVTYYDVPQSFGVTPYRYTVVNGQTILVEPRSRRIVQVVE